MNNLVLFFAVGRSHRKNANYGYLFAPKFHT